MKLEVVWAITERIIMMVMIATATAKNQRFWFWFKVQMHLSIWEITNSGSALTKLHFVQHGLSLSSDLQSNTDCCRSGFWRRGHLARGRFRDARFVKWPTTIYRHSKYRNTGRHGGIIRMETAWGNSTASWAEAGIVGFPQSPKTLVRSGCEEIKKWCKYQTSKVSKHTFYALNSLKHRTISQRNRVV